MRKLVLTVLLATVASVFAFESSFLGKFTIEKSAANNNEKIESLSVVNERLVIKQAEKVYMTKFSATNDVIVSEERIDLEKFGIDGQFSEYKNTLYFSSDGILYSVVMNNGIWEQPQELNISGYGKKRQMGRGSSLFYGKWRYKSKGATKEKMYNPCIANRGKRLYFSSKMEGGMGGLDIWYIDLQEDGLTWSKPVNVPGVNSINNEDYPFVDAGNILYFSSDRSDARKGFNIFKKFLNSKDSAVIMGNDFNSNYNDYNFIVVGGVPFFLSDKIGNTQLYFAKSKKDEED